MPLRKQDMNFKFSPEFRQRLIEMKERSGLSYTAIVERGTSRYLDELETVFPKEDKSGAKRIPTPR